MVIEAEQQPHVAARGHHHWARGHYVITSHLTGAIRDDARTRQEFLRLTRAA